jgi:hypothetical protein
MVTWLLIFCITLMVLIVIHGLRHAKAARESPCLYAGANATQSVAKKNVPVEQTPASVEPDIEADSQPLGKRVPLRSTSSINRQPYFLDDRAGLKAVQALQSSDPIIYRVLFHDVAMAWTHLNDALLNAGARYDQKIASYHVLRNGSLLYSVTNAKAPGTLPQPDGPTAGARETIQGLMLLLPISEPSLQLDGFNELADFAVSLMREGGTLYDKHYHPMTVQTLSHERFELIESMRHHLIAQRA